MTGILHAFLWLNLLTTGAELEEAAEDVADDSVGAGAAADVSAGFFTSFCSSSFLGAPASSVTCKTKQIFSVL